MILIIAAMDVERDALKALGENIQEKMIQDIPVVEMNLNGRDVVLSLSGVGKINAAFTTTLLCQTYQPDLIVNIGSAGGLQTSQKVGDIVIADHVFSHDFDIGPNTYSDTRFIYVPDALLSTKAYEVTKNLELPTHMGVIVSGDQFITHGSDHLKRIQTHFPDAICVEMEASAIGGVAKRLKVPFMILRSLSDVPLKDGNEVAFEKYLPIASKNSAQITYEFIGALNE